MSKYTPQDQLRIQIERCERNINTVRVFKNTNGYRDLSDDFKAFIDARSEEFVHFEVVLLRKYKKELNNLTLSKCST